MSFVCLAPFMILKAARMMMLWYITAKRTWFFPMSAVLLARLSAMFHKASAMSSAVAGRSGNFRTSAAAIAAIMILMRILSTFLLYLFL